MNLDGINHLKENYVKLKMNIYYLTNGETYNDEALMDSWGADTQERYVVIGVKTKKLYLETWKVSYNYEIDDYEGITHRQYLGIIKDIKEYFINWMVNGENN